MMNRPKGYVSPMERAKDPAVRRRSDEKKREIQLSTLKSAKTLLKPESREPKPTLPARIVATVVAELHPYLHAPEGSWPGLLERIERRVKTILGEEKGKRPTQGKTP